MTIYIDTLIFSNIIIDYLLLSITTKILKINYKLYRIILGSLFGGISSLTILLPWGNFLFNFVVKLTIISIIILISFGYINKITFGKRTFVLFLITSLFSGLILFMLSIIKSDFIMMKNNIVYFNISPILLIIFTTISYFILSIIEKIRIDRKDLIHKITFIFNDNKYSFLSKYDTCCNIKEPFSGNEAILVEKELINTIIVPEGKIRIIPFNSLGGEGLIEGFLPDELYIDNNRIEKQVYIGITNNIFKNEVKSIFNYKNICEWFYD